MTRFTEAQKELRRQEILAAAERCFSRNGFHATTIADIVRELGVSQGTFYLYFGTKDDVIAALADDRNQGNALISAMADAEADPVAGLTVMLERHGSTLADAAHADERRVTIQGWAEALRNDAVRKRSIANTLRVQEAIASLIARGQKSGTFKADADPQGVARTMIALFRGLTLMTAWEGKFDSDLTAKPIEDMLRGALLPVAVAGRTKPGATRELRR